MRNRTLRLLISLLLSSTLCHAQEGSDQRNFVYHYIDQVTANLSMTATDDGNLIVGGSSNNKRLIVGSFTGKGARNWSIDLASDQRLTFGDLATGPEGRIWLAYQEGFSLVITTLTRNGEDDWTRTYQKTTEPERRTANEVPVTPESLVPYEDGMMVFGFGGYRDESSALTLKLSPEGEVMRCQTHDNPSATQAGAAALAADSGLIAGFGRQLSKLDKAGQPVYNKEFRPSFDRVANIVAQPGGGFYALLTTESGARFTLINVDDQGALEWRTPELLISGSASTQAKGLALAPDNGALIAGRVNTAGTTPRNEPAVVKVSPDGSFEFLRYFRDTATPNPLYAEAAELIPNPKGLGYFLTGKSSQVQNTGELFLIGADNFDTSVQCIGRESFSTGGEPDLFLLDSTLNRTSHGGFLNSGKPPSALASTDMDRVVKCLTCEAAKVDIGPDTTLCPGGAITLEANLLQGTYSWSTNAGDTAAITARGAGTYWVQAEGLCGRGGDTMALSYHSRIEPRAEVTPKEPDPLETVTFSTGNRAVRQARWQVDSTTTLEGSPVQHRYEKTGRYQPVLSFSGPNDCRFQDSLDTVPVLRYSLFMPDAFTPDQNDTNDLLKPKGFGLKRYKLTVYNRWGEEVFQGENRGWDGRYNGEPVEAGVYFYTLEVRNIFNNVDYKEGRVTVLR